MLQGVIFDMDGVLFDTERIGWRIETEVMAEMGHTLLPEMQVHICGASHAQGRKFILKTFGETFNYDAYTTTLHSRMAAELARDGLPKKPGVDFLLAYLKQNNYKIGLASSTRHKTVQSHLHVAGINTYFDAIIGGDMVANGKPAPDIFEAAAKAMGLPPKLCAAIEDSVNGINSAAAAGCVSIMVPDLMPPTDELRQTAATVLDSLYEVPAYLEGYNAGKRKP